MYDEDDDKEELLKGMEGEVDDFAADKLPPGVTITISVGKPKEESPDEEEGESAEVEDAEGGEDHDPIGHILGMCGGGCTK